MLRELVRRFSPDRAQCDGRPMPHRTRAGAEIVEQFGMRFVARKRTGTLSKRRQGLPGRPRQCLYASGGSISEGGSSLGSDGSMVPMRGARDGLGERAGLFAFEVPRQEFIRATGRSVRLLREECEQLLRRQLRGGHRSALRADRPVEGVAQGRAGCVGAGERRRRDLRISRRQEVADLFDAHRGCGIRDANSIEIEFAQTELQS
jgi:hypothetical protein